MKRLITICVVTVITSMAYALPSDNFDDNSMDTSLWNLYQEDPNVWLDETNQRLELLSTSTEDAEADYFANGWGLLPTDNFSLKVDFFRYSPFSGPTDADAWVQLGLAKDLDNFIVIEAGCGTVNEIDSWLFYHYCLELDDSEGEEAAKERTTNDGTLYISYDVSLDELYLSDTGYWAVNAWGTIQNVLQGTWNGGVVTPYLGGMSCDGMILDSGDAYLDNFVVDSGTIVPICQYTLAGDLNNDCEVDFRDFAIMAANWLIDCDVTPGDPACVSK